MFPNPQTEKSPSGARYYHSDISIWLSVDPMADKNQGISSYNYCHWNPIMFIDPNGNNAGWIDDGNGTVFWDQNTNSPEEFAQNYAGKSNYKYVSDIDNPNCYTLPSGEGKLVMNNWTAPKNIEDGSGHVQLSITFYPTNKNAVVGWIQTYSSNITDVNSGNLYTVLPEENSSERLDGFGVQQSTDVSKARYIEGFTGFGKPVSTLDDGPQRAKNPGAKWDVSFYAQSTVLLNGIRTVSLGWGFTVRSENYQDVIAPMILNSTSEFHDNAVKSLIQKILSR